MKPYKFNSNIAKQRGKEFPVTPLTKISLIPQWALISFHSVQFINYSHYNYKHVKYTGNVHLKLTLMYKGTTAKYKNCIVNVHLIWFTYPTIHISYIILYHMYTNIHNHCERHDHYYTHVQVVSYSPYALLLTNFSIAFFA